MDVFDILKTVFTTICEATREDRKQAYILVESYDSFYRFSLGGYGNQIIILDVKKDVISEAIHMDKKDFVILGGDSIKKTLKELLGLLSLRIPIAENSRWGNYLEYDSYDNRHSRDYRTLTVVDNKGTISTFRSPEEERVLTGYHSNVIKTLATVCKKIAKHGGNHLMVIVPCFVVRQPNEAVSKEPQYIQDQYKYGIIMYRAFAADYYWLHAPATVIATLPRNRDVVSIDEFDKTYLNISPNTGKVDG